MVSIRLRIFFLAIVTLAAVTVAFYVEYRDVNQKLHVAQNTLHVTDEMHSLSELIHTLQKERGLAAGHIAGHDEKQHELFLQQRSITKLKWDNLAKTKLLKDEDIAINFSKDLSAIHQLVDTKDANWNEIREFYTSTIQNLLELFILEVASLEYSQDISYELQSLFYLANTRENLGLVRATLNRGYQQCELSIQELAYLSHHYGSFNDNLKIFKAISRTHYEKTQDSVWEVEIKNDVYYSVAAQIEDVLNSDGKELSGSTSTWWREATLLIDIMKHTEDAIFENIKNHVSAKITEYEKYLFWYGAVMFIVLITVTLLTVFTLIRILKALSILINSLEKVEDNQDFGLRIRSMAKDEFGQISYSINSLLNYTDKIIKEKEFLATTDLLTGLMNRRSFIAESQKEISRSIRYETPCSIIFCDIDFFKAINDKYGHATGDIVLKEFAKTIKENLRTNDFTGRWGGEEFIIFAPNTNLSSAEKLAQKLREKIDELSIERIEHVTCSFGVAQMNNNESLDQLCERADRALYEAKNSGRNRVCISQSTNSK